MKRRIARVFLSFFFLVLDLFYYNLGIREWKFLGICSLAGMLFQFDTGLQSYLLSFLPHTSISTLERTCSFYSKFISTYNIWKVITNINCANNKVSLESMRGPYKPFAINQEKWKDLEISLPYSKINFLFHSCEVLMFLKLCTCSKHSIKRYIHHEFLNTKVLINQKNT